jgi:hypothetical protein
MDTERVLIIILSSTLSVFLVVGILALIKVIQILDTIKRITEKAEKVAEGAETISEFFKDAGGNLALAKLLHNIAHFVKRKKEKGRSQRG